MQKPGKVFFSATHELITNSENIILRPKSSSIHQEVFIQKEDASIDFPIDLTLDYSQNKIDLDKKTACLDAGKLEFPLLVRKWQHGDKFKPIGLNGNKKLSDFFIVNKLSLFEKENTFVLTSNGNIVRVIGHRIDDKYKVTQHTKKQLTIKLNENLK